MHSILAARTDFSIGESILDAEELIKVAQEKGAQAVAVTDTMVVTGMIDFTTRAKKAGIKPIIGARLRMSDNPTWRPGDGEKKKDMPPVHYVLAYALTETGIKMIYRLLTLGNITDRYYYTAKIGWDDLLNEVTAHPDHLALVMGDTWGATGHPKIKDHLFNLSSTGQTHLYAPLVPVDTPYFARHNLISTDLVKADLAQPLVLRPSFYAPSGADASDIMGAIASNEKAASIWFKSAYNRDFHPLSVLELAAEVKKAVARMEQRGVAGSGPIWAQGLRHTDTLVDAVTYEWSKQPVSLPKMAPDEFVKVVEECKIGWSKRFAAPVFGHVPDAKELAEVYMPRLQYELSVLKKLDFSGYFLLVQDIVQHAKKSEILVGPGRGSVGGSLVAYLMGITECDPIRFGLLFERFINPERLDLPDADLDFMSRRRGEVLEYLTDKYGAPRVAGISNYGTLGPSSAIRDVGRVLEIPEKDYNVSKMVPKLHGQPVPLSTARADVPEIDDFANRYPVHYALMESLEGKMRSLGKHAAGVVVADVDLVERAVLERRKDSEGAEGVVVCWDKRIVEDQGLVKVDILGLNTLDVIQLSLDYIRERSGKRLDLMSIPLDDPKVLDNFAKANTVGIFQFESGGMRKLLKDMAASGSITFEDITAATALYRPGPMESGMMDSFALRKQGMESVDYDHPLMEPVLEETFGVIVYQEQVMKIAQVIAGYSGADADKLRKIMGKKLPEEMKKERSKFVDGCVATIGCTDVWAGNLFDKIEGFAGYGFNKSHSVEYTLISYQAMWLKTYHSVEFYAAALTLLKDDKIPALIRDARAFGIEVGMPDINISTDRFEIVTSTRLTIPFMRIKGISRNTTQAILEARKAGPFKNKEDFIARVEKRKCNKKHQEALDLVGAFARIEPGQAAPESPSRIRDQIELLPGLISAHVPINREMHHDKDTVEAISELVDEYRAAHGVGASTVDGMPVAPSFGRTAAVMIISDAPTNDEDGAGRMGIGRSIDCVDEALATNDIERKDIYWTALIKRPKRGKMITMDEIKTYAPYLQREIKLLQPTIIVLLGTTTVRTFVPDFKGKASDEAGKVIFNKDLDANMVLGFSPGEIYYSPEKQENMNQVFASVRELLE